MLKGEGKQRFRGSMLGREGEGKKKGDERFPPSFLLFLPLLACSRYVRPKGRLSFQRNMIAALLQKALSFRDMTSVGAGSRSAAFLCSTKPQQRDLAPLKRPFKTLVLSRSCRERMRAYRCKNKKITRFCLSAVF